MNLNKHFTLITITLLAVTGCKKSANQPVPKTGTDVYVAGFTVASNGKNVATYWKNGVATKLVTDSTSVSNSNSIMVIDNDIYVTGFITTVVGSTSTGTYPVYWKNGVMTMLPDNNGDISNAACIASQGNDIYIGGTTTTKNGYLAATYWKNGVINLLPAAAYGSEVWAMTVHGTDIYFAGDSNDKDGNPRYRATYWKLGGQPVILTPESDTLSSENLAIQVTNSHIYTAGNTNSLDLFSGNPTLWTDGTASLLTEGSPAQSEGENANGMALSGTDIYVAGVVKNNNYEQATYWKNGVATTLSSGSLGSQAYAIAASGNDIYIAGSINNTGAVYWKNGVAVQLSKNGSAFGIAVVQN